MQLLLAVLFAIAPLQDGYLPPTPPPAVQRFINENTIWDNYTLPEGYETVFNIPVGDLSEYASATNPDSDAYRGMGNRTSDVDAWAPLIAGHFSDLGQDAVDMATRIMRCESGGNSAAQNKSSHAAGLMQVMPFWAESFGWEYEDLFVPELNLWAAREIYDQQGWYAWTCWRR